MRDEGSFVTIPLLGRRRERRQSFLSLLQAGTGRNDEGQNAIREFIGV